MSSPALPAPGPARIVIVGGGPAGLMAAETVLSGAPAGAVAVEVHDRMPSVGRKFLMAGRGGLNLTHSEDLPAFLARYGTAAAVRRSVEDFAPAALRDWAEALGQETFVGSSGRIFPRSMKASPLLRAWLRRLDGLGLRAVLSSRFAGWDDTGAALFTQSGGTQALRPDALVLAMGGASWPRLGSDGAWTEAVAEQGVAVAPLVPANVGFGVDWSEVFRERYAGTPVKGVALTVGRVRVRGEFVVTRMGVEGGAVYAQSAALREAIAARGSADLWIDLKPDWREPDLAARLAAARPGQSASTLLRKAAGLPPVAIGLMREAAGKDLPAAPADLARLIKGVRLRLTGTGAIDRAISSAGGIRLDELDQGFMLRRRPGVFAAGEMLDWEAPTGGYLLQACFATGRAAGLGVLSRLGLAPADALAAPRDGP